MPPRRRSGSRAARPSSPRSASTLVKESRDYATFDRIFDLYFLDLQALGSGLKKALGPEDPRIQEMLDRLASEEGLEMDELTELMLRGEGSDMEMAIREGGQTAGLERLMLLSPDRLLLAAHLRQVRLGGDRGDLSRIMQMLEAKGIDPGMLARIRNYPRPAPRSLPQDDPPARGTGA